MRSLNSWIALIAGLATIFVAGSAIALAARQGNWAPILSVGWIPAVVVATWPGTYRRCRPRRRGQAN